MPNTSDQELQAILLRLCTEVAHDYAWSSGELARERFIQNALAYRLIKEGFEITTETARPYFTKWINDPISYERGFAVDLVIYGRPESGAMLIELKNGIWHLGKDIAKLQGLLKGASKPVVGFAIACISTETIADRDSQIVEAHRLAQEHSLPLVEGKAFDKPMPHNWHHYVVAVGMPIAAEVLKTDVTPQVA